MSLSNMAVEYGSSNRARRAGDASPWRDPAHKLRLQGRSTSPGRLQTLVCRARRNRSGAAAAEFTLVAPVLMGLLFGTFEYGIAFFTYNTMQAAARDVGRQVAINTLLVGSAESAIRARLPNWARDDAMVTVQQSAPANPNINVYTILVTMPMSGATPIQFFSRVANPTLSTELRMKQELPYVTNP